MSNPTALEHVWIPAERVGQIEVREYAHGDQARFTISISEADLGLPTLVGGFIARNPDNHADQWYIARDYFNKHYRIPVEPAPVTSNVRVGERCAESNGWPIYRGERHVATFSDEGDAREYARRAAETSDDVRVHNLLNALNAKQAKIDALMMEFCPGEMSKEQREEWAKHQQPVPADLERSMTDAFARSPRRVEPETSGVHVAGDSLSTSLAMFQHKCSVHIASEQTKPNPDNALIDTLCEAIRLCRENERLARSPLKSEVPHIMAAIERGDPK